MVDAGDSITTYIRDEDVSTIEEFDDYFSSFEGSYSRSDRVKEAMAFYRAIHEVVDDLENVPDPDDMGPRQFRHYVRQAILDLDQREATGEA